MPPEQPADFKCLFYDLLPLTEILQNGLAPMVSFETLLLSSRQLSDVTFFFTSRKCSESAGDFPKVPAQGVRARTPSVFAPSSDVLPPSPLSALQRLGQERASVYLRRVLRKSRWLLSLISFGPVPHWQVTH